MVKNILTTAAITLFLGVSGTASAQKKQASKSEPKFLDDITVEAPVTDAPASVANPNKESEPLFALKKSAPAPSASTFSGTIEEAASLQFKYALLMDTEVEEIRNLELFSLIDDWYGTRYQLGGSTRKGIDCSALVQLFYSTLYGITLPRTAREQYKTARTISRTELQEGDLVFFNTRGGVSHVGIYLQNNKFIHAASSQGVTISDLFDDYWMKRLIGVGRIDRTTGALVTLP
jgi:lipoprotein Spr